MSFVDLSNYTHRAAQIGRIAVTNVLPVNAGDSIEYESKHVLQMQPFTRGLVIDAQIDICSFFVPHRHIYGSAWIDFIKDGREGSIVLPSRSSDKIPHYIPWAETNSGLPAWLVDGYWRIWSRYYRPPNQGISEQLTLPAVNTPNQAIYGAKAAHLPAIWNVGVDTQPDAASHQIDTSGHGVVDTIELEQVREGYGADLDRDWNGTYYTDLLRTAWGGKAGTDADERPTMLMRTTVNTSGVNIYGTAGNNLAETAGRSHAVVNHRIPRRFFGEHGSIWTLCLVRFPPIHEMEQHYLSKIASPTYHQIAGDPRILRAQPPIRHKVKDFFNSGSTQDLYYQPYGMWHYYQPSHVHDQIRKLNAYPYAEVIPADKENVALVRPEDWNEIFLGGGAFHCSIQSENNVIADRALPAPMGMAYTGARD